MKRNSPKILKEDYDFESVFTKNKISYKIKNPWIISNNVSIDLIQGWKLHLSTIPSEAKTLLNSIIPIIKNYNVSFKTILNLELLISQNEGLLGETQIGKFITIYPKDNQVAFNLAKDLKLITNKFHGPTIVTDIKLGPVLYTRYGSFNPIIIRDRFGFKSQFIKIGEEFVLDKYSIPFELPKKITNPFKSLIDKKDLLHNSNQLKKEKVFGPGYIILDIIKSSGKGSVFLTIVTKKISQSKIAIIKEGRKYCDVDIQDRDIRDRLSYQYKILNELKQKPYIPKVYDLFDFAENKYLVIELIKGKSISTISTSPFGTLSISTKKYIIEILIKLVESVSDFHNSGYIHRDLSVNNIWVKEDNEICLLDLELVHKINSDDIPFNRGTPGFISPQQKNNIYPTVKDDIYSLGATILFLFTRIDPRRLEYIKKENLCQSIIHLALLNNEDFIKILCSCIDEDPKRRPDIQELLLSLKNFKIQFLKPIISLSNKHTIIENQYLESAFSGLINGTIKDLNDSIYISSRSNSQINNQEKYDYIKLRSAHTGIAGVLYIISRFNKMKRRCKKDIFLSENLVDWLLYHHRTDDDQLQGLHFGEAGVAVSLAEAINSKLISNGKWMDDYFPEALSGPIDWPDITHGAAGQGISALICSDLLKRDELLNHAHKCIDYLINQQESDGSWKLPKGVESLTGVNYTGFAHGTAGILYFLIEYMKKFSNLSIFNIIENGINWLLKYRIDKGNSCCWPTQPFKNDIWNWWCHGETGISLTFLNLYRTTGINSYKNIAKSALNNLPYHLRMVNLSQCHGLSGLGEIYIEAYRTLKEEEWKLRAAQTVITIQKLGRIDNNKISWLVEDPYKPTADLMIGNGGIAHFLLRYSNIENRKYSFPLLPNS